MQPQDDTSPITSREGGCAIALYASPRASRTQVCGLHDGRVKLQVAAPPVDGAANEAIIVFLASTLGVSKSAITLASGQTGKRKLAHVTGVTPDDARAALGV